MYVRLAFSVMAHMECNILLVDEALSVGDAEFQRKCLAVMAGASREGRTLLVVSHDLSVVQTLCTRALLLDRGDIVVDGPVRRPERYVSSMGGGAAETRLRRCWRCLPS
jgi:lipopolysaccharide transport system ATP-binding protein